MKHWKMDENVGTEITGHNFNLEGQNTEFQSSQPVCCVRSYFVEALFVLDYYEGKHSGGLRVMALCSGAALVESNEE